MVKIPEHHVLNFFYDNDNGCALTAWVKGTRYHIIADPSRLQDRSKRGKQIWRTYASLLEQVKAADQDDGTDGKETAPLFVQTYEDEGADTEDTNDSGVDVSEDDEDEHDCTPTEALQRWMLKPLVSSFPSKEPKDPTLHKWYHCPTKYCDLFVKDGKLQVEEEDSPSSAYKKRMDDLIPTMTLPKYINKLKIPCYSADDVVVLATSADPAPLHPARVQIEGRELFFKTVGTKPFQPMVTRELQVMKKIEAEGLHDEIRVPLLRGIITFGDAPKGEPKGKQEIVGFVIDPISDPTPLTHMLHKDVPEEKRTKWSEESAKMVDILHQHGIIWGDSKGDNFMVDANEDLWIIDFGGSYTEGWVDPELKETEEGDDQGVRKLQNGLADPENYTLDGDEEAETDREESKSKSEKRGAGNKRKHSAKEEEEEGDERQSKQAKTSKSEVGDAEIKQSKSDEAESKPSKEQNDNTHQSKKSSESNNKRKAPSHSPLSEEDEEEDEQPPVKQPKQSSDSDKENQENYCYCNGPDSGRMIACDNKKCKRQWFHFECIGMVDSPSTKKWFCNECVPTHNPRNEQDTCVGTWDREVEEE